MAQYSCIVFSIHIQVIFQHNLVLRQCSCFIRAENIHRTKVLDRVQIFHDRLLFTHGNGTFGKAGCHDHRQHLRSQSYCYGDTKQKSIQPVPFRDTIDKEYQRNHNQHKPDQNPGNCIHAFSKAGLYRFACDCRCHGTKQGTVSGTDNYCCCTSGNHITSHKSNIAVIGDAFFLCTYLRCLFYRFTFTC